MKASIFRRDWGLVTTRLQTVAYLIRKTLGWCDAHGNPQEEQISASYSELERKAAAVTVSTFPISASSLLVAQTLTAPWTDARVMRQQSLAAARLISHENKIGAQALCHEMPAVGGEHHSHKHGKGTVFLQWLIRFVVRAGERKFGEGVQQPVTGSVRAHWRGMVCVAKVNRRLCFIAAGIVEW